MAVTLTELGKCRIGTSRVVGILSQLDPAIYKHRVITIVRMDKVDSDDGGLFVEGWCPMFATKQCPDVQGRIYVADITAVLP